MFREAVPAMPKKVIGSYFQPSRTRIRLRGFSPVIEYARGGDPCSWQLEPQMAHGEVASVSPLVQTGLARGELMGK